MYPRKSKNVVINILIENINNICYKKHTNKDLLNMITRHLTEAVIVSYLPSKILNFISYWRTFKGKNKWRMLIYTTLHSPTILYKNYLNFH